MRAMGGKKGWAYRIATLALCAAALGPLRAQSLAVRFFRLTVQDGLVGGYVNCVFQDRKGFIWLGSQYGLNKFDGVEFTTYSHDPFDANSLSDNWILSIDQDDDGALWIGTYAGGLNRYDPVHDEFTRFQHDPDRDESLLSGEVWSVHAGRRGDLWIGTSDGLCRLDLTAYRETGMASFRRYRHREGDARSLPGNSINALFEDDEGRMWIGAFDGGLCRYDAGEDAFARHPYPPAIGAQTPFNIKSLAVDGEGRVWIGSPDWGLVRFAPETGEFVAYRHDPSDPGSLSGNSVRCVAVDVNGVLWVGDAKNGLNRYDREKDAFQRFRADPDDAFGLISDEVMSLYCDRAGMLWIGSDKGLNRYNTRGKPFYEYVHDPQRPHASLADAYPISVYVDRSDTLWVGGLGGGLTKIQRDLDRYDHFRHNPEDPASLPSDDVTAIDESPDGSLWVGTRRGLSWLPRDGARFRRHALDEGAESDGANISAVKVDRRERLWIGVWGGGLHRAETGPAGDLRVMGRLAIDEAPAFLADADVKCLFEDRAGRLWVGVWGEGLLLVDAEAPPGQAFTLFRNDPKNRNSLSSDNVASVFEDDDGVVWIATGGGGLNRFDPATGAFRHFLDEDGLPSNSIHGVLSDSEGRLWLASNAGLSRMDPRSGSIRRYDIDDGLLNNQLAGAYFRSPRGEIFVGGPKGLNSFFPQEIEDNPYEPPVVFTSFKIFNKEAELPRNIADMQKIRLDYKQYAFSVSFAALDFAVPEKNRFAYKLEGYHQDWISLGNRNFVPFFSLPSGDYTLRVRGTNSDGVFGEKGARLHLIVTPPPWRQWWAYLLYALALAALVLLYLRAQARKLKQERYINERMRRANEKLQLTDKIKDEFLANTSHELRTPLNGMIGLADAMIDGAAGPMTDPQIANLSMIVSSGMRLSNLVNDILDFSKLRRRNIELQRKAVNLSALVHLVLSLNKPMVREKRLRLVNEVDADLPSVDADEGRLEQIMHNLVGNAIKFTERGEIRVGAEVDDGVVRVSVVDTGIGISPERQERIFESFEQVDGDVGREYGGAGLGLAITKNLVELHGGAIWVESKANAGSTFYFTLPLASAEAREAAGAKSEPRRFNEGILKLSEGVLRTSDDDPVSTLLAKHPDEAEFHILMVDDEPINLQVLVNFLSKGAYALSQASNGPEALEMIANGPRFDLVLLDVMMPKMSGYEVCKRIREQHSPDELPIVMLTAKNRVGDIVIGFEAGANDYVVKPVSKNELLVRINTHLNLLKTSRKLKEANQELEEYNRNLAQIVERRTIELQERNAELETLDEIVRAINREVELKAVLEAILAQARRMIPPAEGGAFLALDRAAGRLVVAAAAGPGWRDEPMSLDPAEAERGLGVDCSAIDGQTVVVQSVDACWLPGGVGRPKAALAMPVAFNGKLEGLLVLTNGHRQDAFSRTAVEKLKRLKGHAVSAFEKARVLWEVRQKNQELMTAQRNLIQQEKMAYLGKLTAGIAHELRNPLNFVANFAEIAVQLGEEVASLCREREIGAAALRETAEDLVENAAGIKRHALRAERIVRGMMKQSNAGAGQREKAVIADLLVEQFELAQHSLEAKGEAFDVVLIRDFDADEVPLSIMPREIMHAVQNLYSNAFFALREKEARRGGGFRPELRLATRRLDGGLEFRVRDNGVGVAEENLDKLFTPFFTTRIDGQGVGLGLYICYDIIVNGHQGRIEATSRAGEFTEIRAWLPN